MRVEMKMMDIYTYSYHFQLKETHVDGKRVHDDSTAVGGGSSTLGG